MKKIRECGMSLYDIIARYGSFERCHDVIKMNIPGRLFETAVPGSPDRWTEMVRDLITSARALGHPAGHPLSDIGMTSYDNNTEAAVTKALKEWTDAADREGSASASLISLIRPEKECDASDLAHILVSLDDLPAMIAEGSITAAAGMMKELTDALERSFGTVNDIRRMFRADAMTHHADVLKENDQELRSAIGPLADLHIPGIDNDMLLGYADELVSAKDKMEAAQQMSGKFRIEWNDSVLSVNIGEFMRSWNEISKKKLFAGGAKKAFMNELSKHLKNRSITFERVPDVIRTAKEFGAAVDEVKSSLVAADVIEGGIYTQLRDQCRIIDGIADVIGTKIIALDACGNADRLCRSFANDRDISDHAYGLVSLTTERKEKQGYAERLLVTDIPKASESNDVHGWKALSKKWNDNIKELRNMTEWNRCADILEQEGLGCVPSAYTDGLGHDEMMPSFSVSLYEHLMNSYLFNEPSLADISAYDENASRLRKAAEIFIPICRNEINRAFASGVSDAASSPELQILRDSIATGGKGVTIRSLLGSMKNIMREVCPCIITAPESVPYYLGQDVSFDIVIIDDATLMPTHRAVPLITRGAGAVIAGSAEQTPPSADVTVNTLMSECAALPLPVCGLRWMYGTGRPGGPKYHGVNTFPSADVKKRNADKDQDGICDAVAKALTDNGYKIHRNIGSSKATIDIGVIDPNDPNKYVLGIISEGSELVSPNAMDTDVCYMNMLTRSGWRIYRLRAVGWLRNREMEIDNIINAVKGLPEGTGRRTEDDVSVHDVITATGPKTEADIGRRVKETYIKANVAEKTVSPEALFSVRNRNMIERDMKMIVETESPVAAAVAVRRLCNAYGMPDASPRAVEYLIRSVDTMDIDSAMTPWNVRILWNDIRNSTKYAAYRTPPEGGRRNIREIDLREQVNAIVGTLAEECDTDTDSLVARISEIFGNGKVTDEDRSIIIKCIDAAVTDGLVKRDGNRLISLHPGQLPK
jgi:hypothetical protein